MVAAPFAEMHCKVKKSGLAGAVLAGAVASLQQPQDYAAG